MHIEFKNLLKNTLKTPQFAEFMREHLQLGTDLVSQVEVEVGDFDEDFLSLSGIHEQLAMGRQDQLDRLFI